MFLGGRAAQRHTPLWVREGAWRCAEGLFLSLRALTNEERQAGVTWLALTLNLNEPLFPDLAPVSILNPFQRVKSSTQLALASFGCVV